MSWAGLLVVSMSFIFLTLSSVLGVRSLWVAQELFSTNNCSGEPVAVSLGTVSTCSPSECSTVQVNNATQFVSLECNISDRFAYAEEVFGQFNYIVVEDYAGINCENLRLTTVLPATGTCAPTTLYGGYSIVASLYANGSATIVLYEGGNCSEDSFLQIRLNSGNISTGECIEDYYKVYTSADGGLPTTSSGAIVGTNSGSSSTVNEPRSSSLSGLAIICIVLAAGVVGFMTAIVVWKRRSPHEVQNPEDSTCIVHYNSYSVQRNVPNSVLSTGTNSSYSRDVRDQRSISYFWDDDEIAAARIDRDKVELEGVLSHGGYGLVYSGWFNGQHVAVKMLLPENRKSVKQLGRFLEEVKLIATLEHPRIAKFIGVAWDSLSDMCVLTEFMEGGDLRNFLSSYEAQRFPVGFDETKVRIILHVAHALTYLHSLDNPVIHRDLKSKNILLSKTLDAKLTDFGVSREHVDYTMTAGVGTSRWMAPEILMGEKYDAKVDVFSMGVVMSELDLHALPYSNAMEDDNPSRKMSSTAIVQLVAMGKLRVQFSSVGPKSVVDLGLSCVAVESKERPTAAEALYKLHTILTSEFNSRTGSSTE